MRPKLLPIPRVFMHSGCRASPRPAPCPRPAEALLRLRPAAPDDVLTRRGRCASPAPGFDPGERLLDRASTAHASAQRRMTAPPTTGRCPPQPLTAPGPDRRASAPSRSPPSARPTARHPRHAPTSRVTALAVRVAPEARPPAPAGALQGPRLHRRRRDLRPLRPQGHPAQDRPARRRARRARAGRFSVRAPQFPFNPREGVWRIQVDQHPDLTTDGPLVNLAVDVKRRPLTRP